MIKGIGAVLVIFACTACGFSVAGSFRCLEAALRETVKALELMHCQMEFGLTPLPELCASLCAGCTGSVGRVFEALGKELAQADAADVKTCMANALHQHPQLPDPCSESLERLSETLGKTDLMSQLQSIKLEKEVLQRELEEIQMNQPARLKSYRALGICCGIALAILLM